MTSLSDEEDEREKLRRARGDSINSSGGEGTPTQHALRQTKSTKRVIHASGHGTTLTVPHISSRTLAPSNINKIVKAWLQIVPDELRAGKEGSPGAVPLQAISPGYEQYVANAEMQVTAAF